MGVRKTANGAYRYRYAPFLMPTYYAKRCSPLALPLGELSPQVTERALQPFSNDKINLCTHRLPSPSSLRSATSPKGRGKGNCLMTPCRLAGGILCLNRKDRPAPWWRRRSGPAPPGGPPDTHSIPGLRSWRRCRRTAAGAADTAGTRPFHRPSPGLPG